MNTYSAKIKNILFGAFTLAAVAFTAIGPSSASAASIGLHSKNVSAVVQTGEAKLIKVGHRRGWRGKRFSIHIGTPHWGGYYGYYPRPYYYNSCRRLRRKCAYRHGWRTRSWRRCVRYYGCR